MGNSNAEVAAHIEMATEENVKRGISVEEARRQALIRFGGVEQAKEQTERDAWAAVAGCSAAGSSLHAADAAARSRIC